MIIDDGAEDGSDDAEHGVAGPLLHGSTQSDPRIFHSWVAIGPQAPRL